jgi:trimeric autotransporter adhesin
MTGEGQTAPAGMTGKVTTVSATPPLTPQPVLPVAVLIGGQPASVAFYSEAPGLVSGVMQLNVQIPESAPSGDVPILVSVGGNSTQNGVTISVQ